ncbi:hypothetical protein PIB30_016292 [Stylosanthes scabra]|uniref:Uncharacterized protein n=1 Tax=Stylosanthes scabra TaxID=79078 RepID=A0ABU6Q777_9FABA|nr:hypothetical protein [Stylosanthes scabra]
MSIFYHLIKKVCRGEGKIRCEGAVVVQSGLLWGDLNDLLLPSNKMDNTFVVPVFNVGGWLVRNDDGELVYDGGTME